MVKIKYLTKPTITLLDDLREVVTVQLIDNKLWFRTKDWAGGNGAAYCELIVDGNYVIRSNYISLVNRTATEQQIISGKSLELLKSWILLLGINTVNGLIIK